MKYILAFLLITGAIGFILFPRFNKIAQANPTVIIRNKTFLVELADSDEKRVKGLSKRNTLEQNKGMLFLFEKPGIYPFWMKDTLIPLDMIFINDNHIVTIHKNVQPQPNALDAELLRYAPKEPINYVLEINAGLSEKYGFEEGDEVMYENLGN